MRKFAFFICILGLLITACQPQINTIEETYDVIVVGTDPEGIAAALAAARGGAQTLLIDTRGEVGGLFTLGWLNFLDMNYGPDHTLLTQGIFAEFFNQVEGVSFDIQTARRVFTDMIEAEPNLTLKLNLTNLKIHLNQANTNDDAVQIQSLSATYEESDYVFTAPIYIDATQNGDLAALAGAPFSMGQESIGGPAYGMAVTQVFKIGGVKEDDWQRLRQYLRDDGDVNSGSTSRSAWGFADFYTNYKASQENVQLRGLNIARQSDGCIMINALQIFQIDPLSQESLTFAKEKALIELDHIIPFLQEHVAGMENVALLSVAPELYVRESRHFDTEQRLSLSDVLANRDFEDRIALGSYPVDLQGTAPGADVIIIGNPLQYSIPLGAIIPLYVDNLLIAGRTAGYDPLAHGSARVVPIGMCVGEAAGTFASLALNQSPILRRLAEDSSVVKALQETLIANGAYLPSYDYTPDLVNHPYYEGLDFVRSYGLIQGRYQNDYQLDEHVSIGEFDHILRTLSRVRPWLARIECVQPSQMTDALSLDSLSTRYSLSGNLLDYLAKQTVWMSIIDPSALTRGEMCQLIWHIDSFTLQLY